MSSLVTLLLLSVLALVILVAVMGKLMGNAEQPEYKLIQSKEGVEIRDYGAQILAEVQATGDRQHAIREGFKILADYIFGNNSSTIRSAEESHGHEKIAMTAPVIQEKNGNSWKIRFVMPKKYSLQTLPKPISKQITLISQPERRYAVIRFSGVPDDATIRLQTEKLRNYLSNENLPHIDQPILAFYNPPWTAPFLRRNEVMIELQ